MSVFKHCARNHLFSHLGENVAFGIARLGRHRFEGSDLPEEAIEEKEEADGRFLTQSEHFQYESTA